MGALPIESADNFLLFRSFPYDFGEDLPLVVGPNVYLDETPHSFLEKADSRIVSFALPGYHSGLAIPNSCLHCPAAKEPPHGLEATHLFFWSITGLRLRAPLYIEISGQFEISQDQSIKTATLYNAWSSWQPKKGEYYSGEDIRVAAEIAARLLEVSQSNFRFREAIVLFSQITCGHSVSVQMCYLAIFSALEFLFGPLGSEKASTLARRVAQFLAPFSFPLALNNWLRGEYIHGRSRLVHGLRDVTPWRKSQGTRYEAFGLLHEIARLAILGFLSFYDDQLERLSRSKGKELDNLGPASGKFLEGQRPWL